MTIRDLSRKECNNCAEEIPANAKVCSHCGFHQTGLFSILHINSINAISLAFSLLLLIATLIQCVIAANQLTEARKERISANEASQQAMLAMIKTDSLKNETVQIFKQLSLINTLVKNTSDTIKLTADQLKLISKYNIENSYILASESFLAMGADKAAGDRLEKNWAELTKVLMQQPKEQNKFWDSLQAVFSFRRR